MHCIQCGKEIADKAAICVHCGVAVRHKVSKNNIIGAYALTVLMPGLGFILMVYLLFKEEVAHAIGVLLLALVMMAIWENGAGMFG